MFIGTQTTKAIEMLGIISKHPANTLSAEDVFIETLDFKCKNPRSTIIGTKAILNKLQRNGILTSIRGVSGGYSLARPLDEITVYDVNNTFYTNSNHSPIGLYLEDTTNEVLAQLLVSTVLQNYKRKVELVWK